jgi:hypothetical protein
MATVQVNSWAEFLEAVSVSGDTVVCPENAVWDLAELEPEGHDGQIAIRASVDGRGTEIRNLVIQHLESARHSTFDIRGESSTNRSEVHDIHFLNCDVEGGGTGGFATLDCANLEACTFSAMVHSASNIFYYGNFKRLYRCAINLEMSTAGGVMLIGDNAEIEYLNAKISGSSIQNCILNNSSSGSIRNSYIILDAPRTTALTCRNAEWSVVRCNGANVTSLASFTANNFCLCVDSDFPNVTTVGNGIKLVSENNLRDAGYLQSIGFPIGVDG